jgi:hypothetical protein
VWRILHERFLTQTLDTAPIVSIKCDQLVLKSSSSSQTLYDIRGTLNREAPSESTPMRDTDTSRTSAEMKVVFKPVPESPHAGRLRIARVIQSGEWQTIVTIDVADAWLNVSAVCPSLGQFLGLQAVVKGQFHACSSGRRWSGRLIGIDCASIDCQRLLETDRMPNVLTGIASLDDLNADFVGERLTDFNGVFEAIGGTIRRSFLDDLVGQLALNPLRGHRPPSILPAYEQIRFRFDGNERGICLKGLCGNGASTAAIGKGIVLETSGDRIAYERFMELVDRWKQSDAVESMLTEILPRRRPARG